MLSQTAEYALRAVLAIAAREGEGSPARAAALAGELGVPANYLSKTLHQLAKAGVLRSTRGKHGGFRLRRPPNQITMLEVVNQFDDVAAERVTDPLYVNRVREQVRGAIRGLLEEELPRRRSIFS